MDGRNWKVQLAQGTAVAARHGGVVLLAQPESDAQERFVDEVLAACSSASAEHPDAPGRRLVRQVAALVSQADVDDVPSLGLLASAGADVAAFVVGDVELEISTSGGKEVVSGRDVSTWVDRIVRAPFDTLTVRVQGAGEVDARSALGAGTVRAGSVLVDATGASGVDSSTSPAAVPESAREPVAAPHPAEPPRRVEVPQQALVAQGHADMAELTTASPVPQEELPAPGGPMVAPPQPESRSTSGPFEYFSLTEPLEEQAPPLPTAESDDEDDDDQPQVKGIMCSRNHFNDPTAIYCSVCGISMVHQTHNLVSGRRPPLGVLVFDDGSVIPLSRDYVIGREPEGSPLVVEGATGLQLDDPELKVSRVHARIQLKDWDVRVVDAGSANGTFVVKRGQTEWTRLVPEEPVTITPGTRIAMGGRTMEFDSHHKS